MPSSGMNVSAPAAATSAEVTLKRGSPRSLERLLAVDVGEARENRHRQGRGQQVGRRHPRIAWSNPESDAMIRRFSGADDGLIDGGESAASSSPIRVPASWGPRQLAPGRTWQYRRFPSGVPDMSVHYTPSVCRGRRLVA